MIQFALMLLSYLRAFLYSRHNVGLEILALRQQLAVLKRRRPRPHLKRRDRLFWLALRKVWDRWSGALIVVKPETVVGWHRAGFPSTGVIVRAFPVRADEGSAARSAQPSIS